jgi:hypothetical protein
MAGLVFVLMLLQTPIVGATDAIAFDYLDVDRDTYQVIRFEASWDDQAFLEVTTTAVVLPDTIPGATTYRVIPPFVAGAHTVTFRACRLEGCGAPSIPFPFAFAVAVPPPPAHLRTVPR